MTREPMPPRRGRASVTSRVDEGATQPFAGVTSPNPARGADGAIMRGAPRRVARSAGGTSLRIGEVASGRFRVDAFLARGGMGEVFAATDLELGEVIALKTIRPEIARDSEAIERLKREVSLARRITHTHICRVFDFWVHRRGRARPIHFITMEHLAGERLDERIARVGALPRQEALRIGREIVAALVSAHRAGVVHRDLKPANVMLAPRTVVTDFGIASAIDHAREEDARPLGDQTRSQRWGTPGYTPPEALRDATPIGPAADLYAFGVVFFELLFGRRPAGEARDAFEADLAMLPPRLAAVLRRCLSSEPEERPASAEEIEEALAPIEVAESSGARSTPAGATDRAWFNPRLANDSRPRGDEASAEYNAGLEDLTASRYDESIAHLERAIECEPDFALAYSALAESWSVLGYETRAIAAARQAFLRSGTLDRLSRIEIEARYRRLTGEWTRAMQLQRALALHSPADPELWIRLATLALDAGETTEALEAIEELRAVVDATVDARVELLEAEQAWIAGERARQREKAEQALATAERTGQARVEARARYLLATALFHLGHFDAAEEHFLRARESFTDDPRGVALTQFALALLYRNRGRSQEARQCYESVLEAARSRGQRRDMAGAISNLAGVYMGAGDAATARQFCEDAIREFRELGSQRNLMRTQIMLAIVQSTEGDYEGARAAYRDSLQVARRLKDPFSALWALQSIANACSTWGRHGEAHRAAEESRRIAEQLGDPVQVAHSSVFASYSLAAWGRLHEADRELDAALATLERVGDLVRVASSRLMSGQVALLTGRVEEARRRYQRAYEEAESLKRPQFLGWALAGLAEVALCAGDLSTARDQAEEALRIRQELKEEWSLLNSFYLLAQIDLADGRHAESIGHVEESIARARKFTRRDDEALAASLAAVAALRDEAPAEAERWAADARRAIRMSESFITRSWVELRLAEVDIAAGRVGPARESLERLLAFAERSDVRLLAQGARRLLESI